MNRPLLLPRSAAFLILLLASVPQASAREEAPKKAPPAKPQRFTILEDGKEIGSATLRTTIRESGRFASWKERFKPKGMTPLWVIHQKKSDGSLRKYQRLEDKRLGAGVIAFSKGNMVRIVGKNVKRATIEIETAYHALWDSQTWLSMWDWPTRLGKSGDAVRMAIYNVQNGAKGAAEGTKSAISLFKKKDGTVVELDKWEFTGLLPRPLTVYVTTTGKLAYLSDGKRTLIRSHLSLTPPPPPEEPEGAAAEGDGAQGQAKDAPADAAPAKAAPAKAVPAKAVPAKAAPAKAAPGKDTPGKDTPAKDTPAKDTPAKDTPGKDTPTKEAP